MAEVLSIELSALDEAARRRAWSSWLHASAPGLSLVDIAATRGNAASRLVGETRLCEFRASGPLKLRGHAAGQREGLIAALQLTGTSRVVKQHAVHTVEAGQVYIGRTDPSFVELTASSDSHQVVCRFPWRLVHAVHPQLEHAADGVYSVSEPGVALLRDALVGAAQHEPMLDALQQRIVQAALVQLVALPMSAQHIISAELWRIQRALASVAANVGDPGLDAQLVAKEQAISRRHLDHLFVRRTGRSIAATIADYRLEQAGQWLRDPLRRTQSIAQVAHALGFRDPGNFTKAFKARFHQTPRQWRNTTE